MYDSTVDGSMRWVPLTTMCWIRRGASAGAAAAGGGATGLGGALASADGPATASPRANAGAARMTRANRVMWLIQSSLALAIGIGRRPAAPPKFQKRFRRSFQVARRKI